MPELKLKKMYYSITEVGKLVNLKPHILRYWESEFSILRPKKNRAGNRMYREKDIKTVLQIKKLLYKEGYTIEGAKKKLKLIKEQKASPSKGIQDYENLLDELKKDIIELADLMNIQLKD